MIMNGCITYSLSFKLLLYEYLFFTITRSEQASYKAQLRKRSEKEFQKLFWAHLFSVFFFNFREQQRLFWGGGGIVV